MELIAQADAVLALGTPLNVFSTPPGYGIDYWLKEAAITQVENEPGPKWPYAAHLTLGTSTCQALCMAQTHAAVDKLGDANRNSPI